LDTEREDSSSHVQVSLPKAKTTLTIPEAKAAPTVTIGDKASSKLKNTIISGKASKKQKLSKETVQWHPGESLNQLPAVMWSEEPVEMTVTKKSQKSKVKKKKEGEKRALKTIEDSSEELQQKLEEALAGSFPEPLDTQELDDTPAVKRASRPTPVYTPPRKKKKRMHTLEMEAFDDEDDDDDDELGGETIMERKRRSFPEDVAEPLMDIGVESSFSHKKTALDVQFSLKDTESEGFSLKGTILDGAFGKNDTSPGADTPFEGDFPSASTDSSSSLRDTTLEDENPSLKQTLVDGSISLKDTALVATLHESMDLSDLPDERFSSKPPEFGNQTVKSDVPEWTEEDEAALLKVNRGAKPGFTKWIVAGVLWVGILVWAIWFFAYRSA